MLHLLMNLKRMNLLKLCFPLKKIIIQLVSNLFWKLLKIISKEIILFKFANLLFIREKIKKIIQICSEVLDGR